MSSWRFKTVASAVVGVALLAAPVGASATPFAAVGALVSAAIAQSGGTDVNVKVDIDYKKLGEAIAKGVKTGWKKLFGRHPIDQEVFRIEDRWDVVIIKVTKPADGGRITNGMHLSGVYGVMDTDYRIFFANTSVKPTSLRMQAKKNEKWAKDGNWGGIITHGYKGKLPGAVDRYFAARSAGWTSNTRIVIAPATMPVSKLERIPGIKIRR